MKTRFSSTKLLTALMILCLVLLLALVSVFAAEPAAATADFTAADNGAAALALLNAAKTGTQESAWDPSSKTLMLRGVDFTTTATTAVKLPAGATIVLADGTKNMLTGGDSAETASGKHTLTVVYSDGECSADFEIRAAQSGGATPDPDEKPDPDDGPQTGNGSLVWLWIVLLLISGGVLAGGAYIMIARKKKYGR